MRPDPAEQYEQYNELIEDLCSYPGLQSNVSDFRVPTVICYGPDGSVRACGAEAEALEHDFDTDLVDLADEDSASDNLIFLRRYVLFVVQSPSTLISRHHSTRCRFKLHLRPDELDANDPVKRNLPPLPAGKTIVRVFADFLVYLFACARKYIKESAMNGEAVWKRVQNEIEFVLAHPNGWEGPQQGKMREAAILAKLVPNDDAGRARVHFVTEGEASIHYCILNGLINDLENDDDNVRETTVLVLAAGLNDFLTRL